MGCTNRSQSVQIEGRSKCADGGRLQCRLLSSVLMGPCVCVEWVCRRDHGGGWEGADQDGHVRRMDRQVPAHGARLLPKGEGQGKLREGGHPVGENQRLERERRKGWSNNHVASWWRGGGLRRLIMQS